MMAPWQAAFLCGQQIDGLIVRAASSRIASPPNRAANEPPQRSPPGYMAFIPMISVMVVFIAVLIFCFRLRRCIDARDIEAARTAESKVASPRLNRLENSAKAQTLEEWAKNQTGTTDDAANMQYTCAICLEGLNGSDMIRQLPCLHIYHQECLDRWYRGWHVICPLCQRTFLDDPPKPPKPVHTALHAGPVGWHFI
ncbi:hypothetical protein GJ744_002658 [Endocarpon pusillum]|uniref:RING-type domain-containing protein n=1 Tax=Endocarpon pusillum TaxID=364733 RepID=A0A8H7AFA7_9EURO|nr:hypothetical protein GJ744_002658 [Endocarpon pusillum]